MLKEMFSATYKENKFATLCYVIALAIFSVAYIFHPAGYAVSSYAVFFVGACLFGYLALYSKTACGKLPFRSCAVIIVALFTIPEFISTVVSLASYFDVGIFFYLLAMVAFAAFAVAILIVGFAGIKEKLLNLIFALIGLGGVLFLFVANVIFMAQVFAASTFFNAFIFLLVPLGFFLGNFFEVFKDEGFSFKKASVSNEEVTPEIEEAPEEDVSPVEEVSDVQENENVENTDVQE